MGFVNVAPLAEDVGLAVKLKLETELALVPGTADELAIEFAPVPETAAELELEIGLDHGAHEFCASPWLMLLAAATKKSDRIMA